MDFKELQEELGRELGSELESSLGSELGSNQGKIFETNLNSEWNSGWSSEWSWVPTKISTALIDCEPGEAHTLRYRLPGSKLKKSYSVTRSLSAGSELQEHKIENNKLGRLLFLLNSNLGI